MADFSYLSDNESQSVEQILAEAMDHCTLEQVAAINCASFSNSSLPSNLESRFQRLKTLPSNSSKPQLGHDSVTNSGNSTQPISQKPTKNPQNKQNFPIGSSNSSSGHLSSLKFDPKKGEQMGKDQNFGSKKGKCEYFEGKYDEFMSNKGKDSNFISNKGKNDEFMSKDSNYKGKGENFEGKNDEFGSKKGKDGNFLSRSFTYESNSSSGLLSSPNKDQNFGSKKGKGGNFEGKNDEFGSKKGKDGNFLPRSFSYESDSSSDESTKAVKSGGCCWCSPKKKKKEANRIRTRVFELNNDDDWGKHDEILSDLKSFSEKKQKKLMKLAKKEEEMISKEAEEIVKWAKQTSSRMEFDEIMSDDDDFSDDGHGFGVH